MQAVSPSRQIADARPNKPRPPLYQQQCCLDPSRALTLSVGCRSENLGRVAVRTSLIVQGIAVVLLGTAAQADDLKIGLMYGKTGPLEAYAKQTETGLPMGLEYATNGTITLDGRKIVIITNEEQSKPEFYKAAP